MIAKIDIDALKFTNKWDRKLEKNYDRPALTQKSLLLIKKCKLTKFTSGSHSQTEVREAIVRDRKVSLTIILNNLACKVSLKTIAASWLLSEINL